MNYYQNNRLSHSYKSAMSTSTQSEGILSHWSSWATDPIILDNPLEDPTSLFDSSAILSGPRTLDTTEQQISEDENHIGEVATSFKPDLSHPFFSAAPKDDGLYYCPYGDCHPPVKRRSDFMYETLLRSLFP